MGNIVASPPGRRLWLQRLIARGYEPDPQPTVPVTGVVRTADGFRPVREECLFDRLSRLPAGGIAILFPTYVSRCALVEHAAGLAHVIERLVEVRLKRPDLPLTLWVGMQHTDGDEDEAVCRLAQLGQMAEINSLNFVGLALRGPGKMLTINASVRLSRGLDYEGWLWIDDDIDLEPHCLARLVARFFERGCRGAVGANKTGLPKAYWASRVLSQISRRTTPPRVYPTACCMIVQTKVIECGIPVRRVTDDGFVLFQLLDPAAGDPLHDLEVVADARCRFYTAAHGADNLRRLRRSMYSHVTCMADYPWSTARWYFSETLFFGLWPLGSWDNRGGQWRGAIRWLIKATHFGWFLTIATTLLVRGLAKRPIRHLAWGSDSDYRTSSTAALRSS